MRDVPELDIVLLDRKDLPSVGGGETPIIAVAPAIANALLTLFDDVLVITLPDSQISIAFASSQLPFDTDTLAQFAEQSGETNFTILDTPTLHAIAVHATTP